MTRNSRKENRISSTESILFFGNYGTWDALFLCLTVMIILNITVIQDQVDKMTT